MTEFRRERLLEVAKDLRADIDKCKLAMAQSESHRECARAAEKYFDQIRARVVALELQLQLAATA